MAQVIVGVMEFKKGNTFGTVAFTSYGLFWWSLVALKVFPVVFPNAPASSGLVDPTSMAMAAYFFMWGLFTFTMFFGTLKTNRTLQFVFISLAILFFMLTIKELTGNPTLFGTFTFNNLTGIEGVICGLSAVYLAFAEVLNEAHQKTVLPISPAS